MQHSTLWSAIRSALALWTRQTLSTTEPNLGAGVQALRETDLSEITALIDFPTSTYTPCDLVIAVGMIALGPRQDGDPPDHHWETLRQIAQAEVPLAEPAYWGEVVIAWGCGWRRTVEPQSTTWEGEWEYAMLALCSMVAGSVHATIRHLARMLANKYQEHPIINLLRERDYVTSLAHMLQMGESSDLTRAGGELALYANHITMELLDSLDTSDKTGPFAAPAPRHTHQLSSWQPADRPLRVFIAEAVRGSASNELQTGAFRYGLLYPLLQEDFGIRVDFAEFKLCHSDTCNGPIIQRSVTTGTALKITDARQGIYEGHRCPICHTPAVSGRTYAIARRNWLIVPYDYGGRYEMQARWHCKQCGTLFPISLSYIHEEAHIKQIESYLEQLRDLPLRSNVLQALSDAYDVPLDLQTARNKLRAEHRAAKARRQRLKATSICPLCQHGNLSQRLTYVWVLCRSTAGSVDE